METYSPRKKCTKASVDLTRKEHGLPELHPQSEYFTQLMNDAINLDNENEVMYFVALIIIEL